MNTKTKTMLTFILAIAILTGCSNEKHNPSVISDHQVAYVSIHLKTPSVPKSRTSSAENASDEENAIKTLYAIAFDGNNNIATYGSDEAAQKLTGFESSGADPIQEPDVFRVPASARKLLLIANPGEKLETVLTDAVKGIPYGALNAAITTENPYANEVASSITGYTMINCGQMVDSDNDAQDNANLCLNDISGNVQVVGDGDNQHSSDAEAIEAAKNNRVTINMERLTAKIKVGSSIIDGEPSPNVKPSNLAVFTFDKWTLDAINTKLYPWAKRIKLVSVPTPVPPSTIFYTNNFYTIDPNYDDNTGIAYNPVEDYSPTADFKEKNAEVYCLENTMRAAEQKYKNASRVVIKGTYYPDKGWTGDWYSFGGIPYKDFNELLSAYGNPSNVNLIAACNQFLAALEVYAQTHPLDLDGIDRFDQLTQEIIDDVVNGGEVVKDLVNPCIRWYQKGVCYYWYEIRHDDIITGDMEFGKYGIVRNNVYNLTLNSVSKAGSPWYPSVDPGEGEKDPDPEDPIDQTEGYIGVTVEIAPWVKWEHTIDV